MAGSLWLALSNELDERTSSGSSQGRHYRESLFWAVRSFESRSGHRAHPRGACDHGRPRAAPRQINARSWERHFQRRDASGVIALLERLVHMSPTLCERLVHMSRFRERAVTVQHLRAWKASAEALSDLRALDCGRGHRDRLRCEWKARRRVCLVVVWGCVRSFGIVLWDFAGFPECFWALSSGRATARAATKFHVKDLSHTQLRVSAPLNSPLRSQVARSALRRLSLPVFSPFPLLALILPLVLLCVVFFTRSPLPTPAHLRFCACVLLRAVSCRCRLLQWRWCRRRRVESPLEPPAPPCCCGCWAKARCVVNISS